MDGRGGTASEQKRKVEEEKAAKDELEERAAKEKAQLEEDAETKKVAEKRAVREAVNEASSKIEEGKALH